MRRSVMFYGGTFAVAVAFFLIVPQIDVWCANLFYREGSFYLSQWWPVRTIYAGVPYLTDAIVVVVAATYCVSLWGGRPIWRIDGRAAAFLLLALALGPGLVVNTALKDHWGRARPTQIAEFGGAAQFTPAPLPAQQCARNCSFPAGHPAIGFYLGAFAMLARERGRRRSLAATAMVAGAAMGLARMAQGGHFLSDVVFSGLIVTGTNWLLYQAIMVKDWLRPLARLGPPRRIAGPALALLAALVFSMLAIDRPVAWLFHATDERVRAPFQFITQFGLGKGYLIVTAILFAAMRGLAAVVRDARLKAELLVNAQRALFVFVAVAVAGLTADLLKVIFGRARPKLLFLDGTYGFAWGATQADHWSFPSGHATTIAALATTLYLLWPRGLPLYLAAAALVTASRFIIGAHYLSDALAGAALGCCVSWAIWRWFARVPLAAASAPAQPLPAASGER
ncbi:MAG TPA: phosphatase PAP2 family protein [Stellaceae bacterium]|nr:phosphatase PAP2 family protein [Stellaceae bacterium]